MAKRLTQKQFLFCSKYVELGNASEAALVAGYSARSIRNIASINLTKANIKERIAELRQKIEDELIADPIERRKVLTEIARGRVGTLLDDSQRIKQGEPLTEASIQEIDTFEIKIGKGENAKLAQVTKIKLHNPMQAIDLLNKMDKLYTDGAAVNIDNRTLTINVASEKAKELTERLIGGERTK